MVIHLKTCVRGLARSASTRRQEGYGFDAWPKPRLTAAKSNTRH